MTASPLLASLLTFFFFFNDTATTEIYTLSLHDALPISDEPLRAEERWIDSLGEPAELIEGGVDVVGHLCHDPPRFARIDVCNKRDLDPQGDQVLLRAVVKIPFEPPALLLSRGQDPRSRRTDLARQALAL